MEGLRSAVDELASEQLGTVDAADLAELYQLRQRLEAEWLQQLAAFDRQEGYTADGAGSAQSWLRWKLRLTPAAAREQVTLAHRLQDLPVTAQALADGEIGYAHVRVIASADLPAETMAEAEPVLVQAAREVDATRLGRAVTHLRNAVDPDGAIDEANDRYEQRRLYASASWQGMVMVDGALDAEGGATVLTALDAASHPDPAGTAWRTPAQRRADALVDICRWYLDHGDAPDKGGERPHVTVTVDLATLEGRVGATGAELGWGGVICGETARRLACDAGISRVITDGASQPLDVGRRTRTPPTAVRRALAIRDKGCRFPGCDRPPQWTDAHHVEHWVAHQGPTKLGNLVLLCRAHHRAVHEGRQPLPPQARPPPTSRTETGAAPA